MRNRKLLFTLAGLAIVVIAAFLAITSQTSNKKAADKPTEAAGLGYVAINNTTALSSILLAKQEAAVEQGLSDYILSKVSPKAVSASIVGDPQIQDSGVISINVRVAEPKLDFQATIDRNTYFDKVILTIPTAGYQRTIPVYTSNQGD